LELNLNYNSKGKNEGGLWDCSSSHHCTEKEDATPPSREHRVVSLQRVDLLKDMENGNDKIMPDGDLV